MIKKNYLIGSKNEAFGPGGIQNAITETLVRTEGPIDAKLIDKSINENGTYSASAEGADGFKKVTVDVPNTYFLSDEGKVVSNGSLISQTSSTVTENGVVDTTLIDSVTVDVSGSGSSSKEAIIRSRTYIDDGEFYNDEELTSVTLDGIEDIGAQAFKDCINLTSVSLGNDVKNISYGSFEGCSNLTSIILPSSLTTLHGENFINCTSLSNVYIEEGPENLGATTFKNCISLTEISIPSSVEQIGINAFLGCTNLSSITIKKSQDSLEGAPWGAPSTTQIFWIG